jgi:hypothetical protein
MRPPVCPGLLRVAYPSSNVAGCLKPRAASGGTPLRELRCRPAQHCDKGYTGNALTTMVASVLQQPNCHFCQCPTRPGAFYLVPLCLEGAANKIVEDVGSSLYRNPTSRGQ